MGRLIEWYVKMRMYWSRGNSHFSLPLNVYDKILMLIIALKVFGVFSWWTILIISVIGVIAIFIIGYIDVKIGFYKMETSINNKHNPEIQRLLRKR